MSTMNAVPLTKSQKKRMKKNKAKAKKAQAATAAPTELDPFNAHDALRIGLQELGFTLADIDKSIEEMWNSDLDYSDMNAVAAYMAMNAEKRAHEDIQIHTNVNADADADADAASDPPKEKNNAAVVLTKSVVSEEESKTVSTASVSESPPPKEVLGHSHSNGHEVPLTVPEVDQKASKGLTSEKPATACTSTNGTTAPHSTPGRTKRTRKIEKKAPPSLKTKLNIVANNDNLTDAIVALTEWIVKAATPLEVKQLCDATKPCALRTVIRRVIVAPGPRNYAGQLLDLIGSILRIAGIPSTELSMSARALMNTLTKAKDAIKAGTTDCDLNMGNGGSGGGLSDSIADFVTDTVASFISDAVEKISCTSEGSDVTIQELSAELTRVKSMPVPSGGGVGGLVSKRDQLKNLAQKHSKFLTMKISSQFDSSVVSNGIANGSSSAKNQLSEDDMMAQVFGSKFEEISASKAKYDELKKRQVESHASLTKRQSIVSNIDILKSKKGDLSAKIKEIELELQRLTAEESAVDKQITQAQDSLVVLDNSLSTETKEIERSMKDMSQNIKLNDSVLDVVQSLQNFHKEMDQAVSNEIAASEASNSEGESKLDLSPYMTSYVACTNDYFNSEFKLVSFLQQRAQKLRDGFPRLEMEIEECTGLGMTSNVVEMKKKLNQMQQNIADDDNIIKALQKEAEEMKSTLAVIMRQYKSTGADAKSFEATCKAMESTISAII